MNELEMLKCRKDVCEFSVAEIIQGGDGRHVLKMLEKVRNWEHCAVSSLSVSEEGTMLTASSGNVTRLSLE